MPRLLNLLAPALLLLGSCASLPSDQLSNCDIEGPGAAPPPSIDGTTTTLDVLTYNIEGLQWPARSGRSSDLRQIGTILRELRAVGRAPDIILFQEVFSPAAVKGVRAAGYESLASGPSRTQSSTLQTSARLPGRARANKGELGIRLQTSGLIIASRHPIIAAASSPYSRRSCAGFDCLANKGMVLARVAVAGVPYPIDIVNTHMNAQKASRVAPERHLASHQTQSRELEQFLAEHSPAEHPLVLAGDFNMRRSPDRFDLFTSSHRLDLVHQWCLKNPTCTVKLSWDGDQPWMDTQDLQFFAPGHGVRIEPIRVEAMFDGAPESPKLSDHDGLRVTYRLSWNPESARQLACHREKVGRQR